MIYTISNEYLILKINTFAAEIDSLKKVNDNNEIMWQGSKEYWTGRNPILFPQVGNMWAKEYQAKNKTYSMGNHGFTRRSEFTLVQLTNNTVTLLLKDNEETYSQYPYHFELYVTYELINSKVNIKYTIYNKDEEIMPFGFGLHPGFNVPIGDSTFNNTYIEFSDKEYQDNDSGKYIVDNKIKLDYKMFKDVKYNALIYKDINSEYVILNQKDYNIKVGCKDFNYLAFWTVDNAPFICIEPWDSIGDLEESNIPFEKREGMINLDVNNDYNKEYYIEILEGK